MYIYRRGVCITTLVVWNTPLGVWPVDTPGGVGLSPLRLSVDGYPLLCDVYMFSSSLCLCMHTVSYRPNINWIYMYRLEKKYGILVVIVKIDFCA